jgi:hypothetical protein
MRRFIDSLIDVLYPRAPGEPDRATFWTKFAVLAMLAFLIALGILANR